MKSTRWIMLFAAIIACALPLGCDCGDDDDDESSDDDDDDAGPPEGVEDVIERLVSELDTSGQAGTWVAYVTPEPLTGNLTIAPAEGETDFTLDAPYWIAFVDEDPFAWYEHEVKFVYLNDDTGEMTVENQSWWMEVDGQDFLEKYPDLIKVFAAATPEWRKTSSAKKRATFADAPTADYGDAPDDSADDDPNVVYYGGAIAGHYPTVYATNNSAAGRPGGHTLTVGEETIGAFVSAEKDATDPNDPDTAPNLTDNDADDGLFWIFYPDVASKTITVSFLMNVTVASSAPDQDRYINIVADYNRDGYWKKNSWGAEWLVKNEVVKVPPGAGDWIFTKPVTLPLDADKTFGYESWVRAALTREAIDDTPFGADGWDGSGEFEYGEIEDHYYNFEPWPGDDDDDDAVDDDDDDDDNGGGPGPKKPQGGDPGSGVTPKDCTYTCLLDLIDIPVDCKALVINFGDKPNQNHVTRDARKATTFFEALLGAANVTSLPAGGDPLPTADEALEAIQDFVASSQCLDELIIYISGHGGKSGYIRAQNGRGKLTPEQFHDAITAQSHCPDSMDYYTDGCSGDGYCNLNIFLTSCYAGNFTTGDNSLAMDGVNVMTASSDKKKARGKPDGDGAYVSDSFFDAYKDSQADDPPNGDGDGEVSNEEAMKWAKEHYGGPDTGADFSAAADCDCQCTDLGWLWEDPEDDLIYWESKAKVEPVDVGYLDILTYGISPTASGFDALISVAEDLPAAGAGWYEYYMVFDTDAGLANGAPGSVTHDGDTAYVPYYLNGVWDVGLYQNNGTGMWVAKATGATIDISGKDVVIHIDPDEEGIDLEAPITPVHAATWYKEGGTTSVGDDTAVEDGTTGKRCFWSWTPFKAPKKNQSNRMRSNPK